MFSWFSKVFSTTHIFPSCSIGGHLDESFSCLKSLQKKWGLGQANPQVSLLPPPPPWNCPPPVAQWSSCPMGVVQGRATGTGSSHSHSLWMPGPLQSQVHMCKPGPSSSAYLLLLTGTTCNPLIFCLTFFFSFLDLRKLFPPWQANQHSWGTHPIIRIWFLWRLLFGSTFR